MARWVAAFDVLRATKQEDIEKGVAIEVAVLSIQGVENNSTSERDVRARELFGYSRGHER